MKDPTETLLLMSLGAVMFVNPSGFLDKLGELGAKVGTALASMRSIDATFGRARSVRFDEEPSKNPRLAVLLVRVLGGLLVAAGTLSIYESFTG